MKNNFKTPVLFLIFNRPNTTKKVFEEIRKAKPRELFVASDGHRKNKEGEKEIVEKTRKMVIDMINWDCEVKTLFREKNLGCKYAVSGAIDWFFKNVEEGIILEDDCLPSQSFFWYCQELLEKYRNDKRIMCISGNCFFDQNKFNDFSYYFISLPLIWGWATWKRAWDMHDINMYRYKFFLKEEKINDIFSEKLFKKNFKKIFDEVHGKKIDTWDYQWCFTCLSNSGLTCTPSKNLIKNIGFSRDATHTKNKPKNKDYIFSHEDLSFPLIHQNFIIKNKILEISILKNHYNINIKNSIKNKIIEVIKVTGLLNIYKKIKHRK
jgi:hypothetical protein